MIAELIERLSAALEHSSRTSRGLGGENELTIRNQVNMLDAPLDPKENRDEVEISGQKKLYPSDRGSLGRIFSEKKARG